MIFVDPGYHQVVRHILLSSRSVVTGTRHPSSIGRRTTTLRRLATDKFALGKRSGQRARLPARRTAPLWIEPGQTAATNNVLLQNEPNSSHCDPASRRGELAIHRSSRRSLRFDAQWLYAVTSQKKPSTAFALGHHLHYIEPNALLVVGGRCAHGHRSMWAVRRFTRLDRARICRMFIRRRDVVTPTMITLGSPDAHPRSPTHDSNGSMFLIQSFHDTTLKRTLP